MIHYCKNDQEIYLFSPHDVCGEQFGCGAFVDEIIPKNKTHSGNL